jgi:peptidoglycan/LPS O-acetylase OafA/YrhL
MAADGRRSDLDWLRVIATIGVFLLHCLKFFDPLDWEVKNNILSQAVLLPLLFLLQWLMPLFVLLSGMSISLGLRAKGPAGFARSRVRRILLPYATVGLLLVIPPQVYVRYVSHGGTVPAGGIRALALQYLRESHILGDGYPWLALPQMHLWYLLWLFVFTMALLPLFASARRCVRSDAPSGALMRSFLRRPGAVLLFFLPVAVLTSLLDPSRPLGQLTSFGGWPLLVYPLFLMLGYCAEAIEGFEEAMARHRQAALIVALLSLPPFLAAALVMLGGRGFQFGTAGFVILCLLRSLNAWAMLVALLGYGISSLRFSNAFLRYASEATLPFYIIHQTVIVLIGYAVAADPVAWGAKLFFLVVLSFIATAATYDLLVRRTNITRFFFGLKPLRRSRLTPAAVAAIVAGALVLAPGAARSAEQRGFSGRIEAGAAWFSAADHLSTDDREQLTDLAVAAQPQDKVREALFFRITYRTEGGSAAYLGIPYDTSELPLEAGLELPMGRKGALQLTAQFIKDSVWKDPYTASVPRQTTSSYRESAAATMARIGGSGLSMGYGFERYDVRTDELGDRLPELRRDGSGRTLSIAYAFEPSGGLTIVPTVAVGRTSMDGEANSADSLLAGFTVTRSLGNTIVSLRADAKRSVTRAPHPLFGKEITYRVSRLLLVWNQGCLFGHEQMFSNVFAGAEQRRADEEFLKARKLFTGVTIGYRF